jgi:arylformamidase
MIYDLSQHFFHDAPQWATYAPSAITHDHLQSVAGFNAERVNLTTHTGTHVDAPFHFFNEGETVDQLPLEHFVAQSIAVDLRSKTPGSRIEPADLEPALEQDVTGFIILLKTGWGDKRAKTKEYLLEYPYLTGEAARLLVSRKIKGVGTDCLSIGGFPEGTGQPPHLELLGAKKLIVEDLSIPDLFLDGKVRWFAAFPIKLRGTSGSWTRAVAWDPGEFA